MKKIKVIQVGIMHDHAPMTLEALTMHPEAFELAAICPETTAPLMNEDFNGRLERVKLVYPNIPLMTMDEALKIEGLDAVIVESRERDLTDDATRALQAGFPVHMDKPGGESVEAFNAMVDLAKEKHLPFSLGYMYRQNTAVRDAFARIERGEIGDILCVEAHMDSGHGPEKRQWLANYKGGMMFFLGCHLIDLIVRLQGEPEQVLPMNTCTNTDGVTALDYGFALLKYSTGWSFAKTSANEPGGFARRQLVIIGTKGQIEIKPLETNTFRPGGEITSQMRVVTEADVVKDGWNAMGTHYDIAPAERYAPMLLDFASYVRGEAENPYTYEYEKTVYRVLMQACGLA